MSVYLNKGIAKRPKRNKQSTPRDAGMWTPAWGVEIQARTASLTAPSFSFC